MRFTLQHSWLLASLFLGLTACQPDDSGEAKKTTDSEKLQNSASEVVDRHSHANFSEVELKHVDLDLTVDFESRQLKGNAELAFDRLDPAADTLVLDTRDLTVEKVEALQDDKWRATEFELAEADPVLGSKLSISLPEGSDRVRVHYQTSPDASGLQWLEPSQTAGKQHPYMYSQSQAIHARSWLPIQDSPQVRVTYNANIHTPEHLLAVMSAYNEPDTELDGDYHFEMPQAIPSYLIAIGAGDLEFKAMSERTGVYAEPSVVDAAAQEFADTEKMIKTAERLFGPYHWGRYDLLILPPSFPFGGMENPRLSFITPTVIAGDRSLVSLIAHELAHSWSGNLVTNATWRDLWLNEGFTSYVENRIMEEVFGEARAVMEQSLARQELLEEMETLEPRDTRLYLDLEGRDPDDAFSDVPYTKGQLLLISLEERFGRETFDVFLRRYFDDHAFTSLTTAEFLDYLESHLLDRHPEVVSKQEIRRWIYEAGLPDDAPNPQSPAFDKVAAEREAWLEGDKQAGQISSQQWTVQEWLHFINGLPQDLSGERMARLDETFGLTASGNNEIAHAWLLLALRTGYDAVDQRLENYLTSIGRRRLIVPLYKELATTEAGKARAQRIYREARPGYHYLARNTIDAILK